MEMKLKVGAGRGEIRFPADMFPTDHLYGVRDVPHARLLVIDGGVRVAIAALELVNAPEDSVEDARKAIEEITGTPYENVWVHVTHAISTPHAPGGPMGPNGKKPAGMQPPPEMKLDPDAPRKRQLFVQAIADAVREAARQAADSFREAALSVGTGESFLNVNRDVETPFGWWLGQNPDGPSNKTMTVLRFDGVDGATIGVLVSYGLKPCAIDNAERDSEKRLVSTDVAGVACREAEKVLGAPVLFCMSAAGDQVPREQAFWEKANDDGTASEVDLGVEKGYEIADQLGAEMGADILRIAGQTTPAAETVTAHACGGIVAETKGRIQMAPRKEAEFKAESKTALGVEAIRLGDIALVAVKPEVNAQTEKELQEASPFAHTLLLSMVNGGMKYMPDQSSYDRLTWEAQSAMLMPGTAEKWVARAADVLNDMKNGESEPVVTLVAEPGAEGQLMGKVYIDFAGALPDVEKITVPGRTVIERKVEGKRVILHLSPEDKEATVIPGFDGPPGGPGGLGGPGGPGGPGKKGPPRMGKKRRPLLIEVCIPGYAAPIASSSVIQLVIDDFVQGEYKGMLYNLFIPRDYDPAKKYPLVLFIPDASANGDDPLLALAQGIGGTCWAEPAEQAKHPCFVLALQIPSGIMLTTDDYTVSPEFDIIMELFHKILDEYSIDRDRLYNTGQSQGCMASCEMDSRWPELFAASVLVAGHWDLQKMSKLKDKHLLFGLSEGGLKEYPAFNAMTEDYERQGVNVAKVRLNFRDGWEINDAKVREAIQGAPMAYVIFDKETAFPDDSKQRPMMAHHNRGWELIYQLEAVRDWMFAQHK